jgi:lipid-binding SYLF domain-containing protein
MIRRWTLVTILLAFQVMPVCAQKKENQRVASAGRVMGEILRIPDNIPSDLLQKAECVIVLPSVLKFALGIGGSYGRGLMVCRGGNEFNGPWGAPSMIALEGGSFGLQLGGQATDFVLLVMNRRGAEGILNQGQTRRGCIRRRRAERAGCRRRDRPYHEGGDLDLFPFSRALCRRVARRLDVATG